MYHYFLTEKAFIYFGKFFTLQKRSSREIFSQNLHIRPEKCMKINLERFLKTNVRFGYNPLFFPKVLVLFVKNQADCRIW